VYLWDGATLTKSNNDVLGQAKIYTDNLKTDIYKGGIFMAQSILIVDDEKEIVSMLYCYFSKLGYTVYTATAGNAALKEVEKNLTLFC
jgi:PleD family two-component response regulator